MIIDELAQEVQSHGSILAILSEDWKMKHVSANFVPRLLNTDQKESRKLAAVECFEKSTEDPMYLEKIVTGDESWVYAYDLEKICSHENGTQRPLLDQINHIISNPY